MKLLTILAACVVLAVKCQAQKPITQKYYFVSWRTDRFYGDFYWVGYPLNIKVMRDSLCIWNKITQPKGIHFEMIRDISKQEYELNSHPQN